ncbi:MAG: Uncharacterized protein Athens101428_746 [Candidatus Berkelbacteria bacterium Athens1014_28]|uniref:PDZ domain-containing protein n=1 Tax=Candidatus Berkelbacteria bacterium Athens1014_28 TaxID=2017145 RepID=A0A554LJM7_9BACT|nr:MAG: Uncharacterized protein Athens101428_746 [Candidatus Berkelbacteria bacterium Athens1014_28]
MKEKNQTKKIIGIVILSLFAAFLLFSGGCYFGYRFGREFLPPSYIKNASNDQEKSIDFSLFWQTWNKVRETYIGDSDPEKMLYGAISGMVNSLGDPYTVFLTPEESRKLSEDLSGEFEGIGAELSMKDGKIVIVAPLSGSPAEKSGLKGKDVILEIDGETTANLTIDGAIDKIRGAAGSVVKLTIQREGNAAPLEFSITREKISVPSVKYETKTSGSKKIAVLKISQFGDDTQELLDKFAKEIVAAKVDGIVVDLRDNPGGYLDTAISASSLFLESGKVVVIESDKNSGKKEYKSSGETVLENLSVVILVNGGSASAAEIFAGALKDNGRAKLVGEKTFGKGSVQEIEPLLGGSSLKVTIAKWLTPSGTEINKVGITPDFVVAASENSDADPQLDKAVELLK